MQNSKNSSAIRFKSLSIKNGKTFEDVVIPLENQGLVSIQGNTGVGKSSVWDILETIIYGSTPEGFKKDELTKNEDDCEYKLIMEKNDEDIVATLQRKNKKWSYDIQKGNSPRTDHTYFDAIKTITSLVGLTKDEFEGSVHLTQSAQHMLIKGSLSERKDYISAFFGIDNRYDEVHLATKKEFDKVTEKIQKLAGLSHSKQMLETELKNMDLKDIEPLQNKINSLQKSLDENVTKLTSVDTKLATLSQYTKHLPSASEYAYPEEKLVSIEDKIAALSSKLTYCNQIQTQNKIAIANNAKLDQLEFEISDVINNNLGTDLAKIPLFEYETELRDLQALKKQHQSLYSLKQEIAQIPDVKELPVARIEEELVNLQVAHQTHLKNKSAKERGICPECGSVFTVQDVRKDMEIIAEIKQNLTALSQDYNTIKTRNQNAKRRSWIMEQLKGVPDFSDQHDLRIGYLDKQITAKKKYDSLQSKLSMLTRLVVDTSMDEFGDIPTEIQQLETLKVKVKNCIFSKKMLPVPPEETEETLAALKADAHHQILNLKTFISSTSQAIGESKAMREAHARLTTQLKEIETKLFALEDLKKEEYFWSKLVEAYGPRGLRVQQLEKMMDLILRHLPVYVSILFNEKSLTFSHKVDANNVRILATRELLDSDGNTKGVFQHDIGGFSGGEKDLMSTAFILTLADCIPTQKRANILILDEVDKQLDEGIKFRFTNELLPMLKKKYSSIFVISHDRNVQLANIYDQIWNITKKNHTSEIQFQTLS